MAQAQPQGQSEITAILLAAQNPQKEIREPAEAQLEAARQSNLPAFLQTLVQELSNEAMPVFSRQLAGLQVKRILHAEDETMYENKVKMYLTVDPQLRRAVMEQCVKVLASPVPPVRYAAAQAVTEIARVELPRQGWNDLIPTLLGTMSNAASTPDHREATLQTLGYICETVEVEVLQAQANEILTAIVQGMRRDEPSQAVRLAGTQSLFNALEFVAGSFEAENERNYIMQVVCETAISEDIHVKVAAFECLVKIVSMFYDKMSFYMTTLFQLTFDAIQGKVEEAGLQGIEFWCAICDEELDIQIEIEEAEEEERPPERVSRNFIAGALQYLVPLLFETLTKQEEDQDDDTWNPSMAAGTCLSLVAQVVGNEVVQHIMPFVIQHFRSQNWRCKEAAVMAFGAILEGPDPEQLLPLCQQAISGLIELMGDQVVLVKDTTTWTLGRICSTVPDAIGTKYLELVVGALLNSIADVPRVAANCCWALHNLAESREPEAMQMTVPLSPYFPRIAQALLQTTIRPDANMNNLRSSAYEALNALVLHAGSDSTRSIMDIIPVMLERLQQTLSMQILSVDDRSLQQEIQGDTCGCLMVITHKLEKGVMETAPDNITWADKMMQLYLNVLGTGRSTSTSEEAIMAVGALANATEQHFVTYMPHFRQHLLNALMNNMEVEVLQMAVAVVSDVCRAVGVNILPFCNDIVDVLLKNLQNPELNKNVKPRILACFGDIALALGGHYETYLRSTMNMLMQAAAHQVDQNDYDLVEFLNDLRDGILEAFTGILQGLNTDGKSELFLEYVPHVVSFIQMVYEDENRTDAVTCSAVGVLGDLAHTLGTRVRAQLQKEYIRSLVRECAKSGDPKTKEIGKWTKAQIGV